MAWNSLNCDSCHEALELSGFEYKGKPEVENAIFLTIDGGYGQFIDPIDKPKGRYEYVLCHDCAMKVAALFPAVMAEHHTSLVPCSCPEYQETKRRFDEAVERQKAEYEANKEARFG